METVPVITLDNFKDRLPKWNPSGHRQRFAFVDMGSNGIRFSISDLTPPNSRLLPCIYRERAAISLFDALSSSQGTTGGGDPQLLIFPSETIAQVAEAIARFRRIAESHDVPLEHFSVLATEAMRRAANAVAMLDAVREAAGVGVEILAPQVETLFGAVMGSRSAFVDVSRGGLFLDLGGGSLQMTWVDTRLPSYEIAAATAGESMPFGAARLTRILEQHSPEAQVSAKRELYDSMRATFARLCAKFPSLQAVAARPIAAGGGDMEGGTPEEGRDIDVYLCGGGFRGYGGMLMHNDGVKPYPIPSVGTYTVTGDLFKQTGTMRRVNAESRDKIHGVSNRRRQQFPAIVEVVEAFIRVVPNIHTATFCPGSNREGALLMKLPQSIRESNPLELLAELTEEEMPIAQSVLDALRSAVPVNANLSSKMPTIFSLGLGPLLARLIWVQQGEDDEANASFVLRDAVSRNPSAPGLTHLARAVLGLTLCARWGANLGPVDAQLYENLRALVTRVDKDAGFWADYFGAVAAILVDLVYAWPRSDGVIGRTVKFGAVMYEADKGHDMIKLKVIAAEESIRGIDADRITSRVSKVGEARAAGEAAHLGRRVEIEIEKTV